MKRNKLKVLLIVEQCDPHGMSVPLLGYRFAKAIAEHCDLCLVTKEKYAENLVNALPETQVYAISPSALGRWYEGLLSRYTLKRSINWPLLHALKFPLYAEFNRSVYRQFREQVQRGEFDLVHAITPMIPRYPVKISSACTKTPFVLGPVNGGLPFPSGFDQIEKAEYANFNFLRMGTHLIPGYRKTYQRASMILSGSRHTQKMLASMFSIDSSHLSWFPENGVDTHNFVQATPYEPSKAPLRLLFVGRLVPYKGAHLLIKALSKLSSANGFSLDIVGDGPERQKLEELSCSFGLDRQIHFRGWVEQRETTQYYSQAQVFCFPSVREFGGAVVLEAMAAGLPCIIVDHGGIAEFVTEEAGVKIAPKSEEQIITSLTAAIEEMISSPEIQHKMSEAAVRRASEFEWSVKGKEMLKLYHQLCGRRD